MSGEQLTLFQPHLADLGYELVEEKDGHRVYRKKGRKSSVRRCSRCPFLMNWMGTFWLCPNCHAVESTHAT